MSHVGGLQKESGGKSSCPPKRDFRCFVLNQHRNFNLYTQLKKYNLPQISSLNLTINKQQISNIRPTTPRPLDIPANIYSLQVNSSTRLLFPSHSIWYSLPLPPDVFHMWCAFYCLSTKRSSLVLLRSGHRGTTDGSDAGLPGFRRVKGLSSDGERALKRRGGGLEGEAGWWEFKHPHFQRAKTSLLSKIKRIQYKEKPISSPGLIFFFTVWGWMSGGSPPRGRGSPQRFRTDMYSYYVMDRVSDLLRVRWIWTKLFRYFVLNNRVVHVWLYFKSTALHSVGVLNAGS